MTDPINIPSLPQLLTQKETAKYLKRSVKSLERDRFVGGGIPFVRVGRLIRYRSSDVLKYLDENTRTSTSQS